MNGIHLSREGAALTVDPRAQVEPPVPPGTPEAMTQGLNDSLEALVRRHMDQWFWIHRRWKGGQRLEALPVED